MEYLVVGLRCLLGLVFLVSAVGKVRSQASFTGFVDSVRRFDILTLRQVKPVAIAVVATEATVAILLAMRYTVTLGFLLAGGLLGVLTGAIAVVVHRGTPQSCRCFGVASAPLGRRHLVRNTLLVLASVFGVAGSVGVVAPGSAHPGGVALAVACGVALALLVMRFDDIVDLFVTPTKQRGLSSR
ncbi:MAG TPA: MauE/DoxX family redox-associated membrane protein [Micromonosporaceae bacterium]|nr:MauE/DoxX family redox-associated membrane protein [Micromonosporaceae bacterium]